ncbi:MAG: AAA family ATPase [Candidatus Peribacteria bacterium]|nr:AAA family ATPase [Candidatus Peribacteria bacterium]
MKQLQEEVSDKETYFINLEREKDKELLNVNPENIFELTGIDSKRPQVIFVDEVQYLQNPSNFLKLLYDEYHNNMKLVVS